MVVIVIPFINAYVTTTTPGTPLAADDGTGGLRVAANRVRGCCGIWIIKPTGLGDELIAQAARERVVTRSAIRDGLTSGQFRAWYEPMVSLPDRAIVGYEALARWHTSDGTVV